MIRADDRQAAQLLALGLAMRAGSGSIEGPELVRAIAAVQAAVGATDPLAVAVRRFASDVVRITRATDDLAAAGADLFAAVRSSCGLTPGAEIPEGLTGRTPSIVILDDPRQT